MGSALDVCGLIVVMLAVGMMIERAQLDVADGLGAVDWVVTGDRW